MGSWGVGIRQDDLVCDVEGIFEDQLKDGRTVAEATRRIQEQFSNALDDPCDGSLIWLALADMQWKYGDLETLVFERVKKIIDTDAGMDLWGKPENKLYKQRKTVLENFRQKISQPNPRPSRPPKRMVRKPKFTAGDCLSIRLENEQYGAAIVLGTDHSNPEQGRDLVGELNYLSDTPPRLEVFTDRHWLTLKHYNQSDRAHIAWYYPLGFRKMKQRISVLANVPLLDSDPSDSSTSCGWHSLGQQVLLLRKWEIEQNL